jgi:uncharacterized CHY-type Zn-finger protein
MLRINVRCFRCNKEVDANKTRKIEGINEPRYECFECFKRHNRDPLLGGIEKVVDKRNYFCGRCKFKFKNKTGICPYCNKDDYVHPTDGFNVKSLL